MKKKRILNPKIRDFLTLSAFTLVSSYLTIRMLLFIVGIDV